MEHPKAVGDRSTLAIMLALRAVGFAIYLPFGENTRSDLVIATMEPGCLATKARLTISRSTARRHEALT